MNAVHNTTIKSHNGVFVGIITISMAIHLGFLTKVTHYIQVIEPSVLELNLEEVSKPTGRDIPIPKFRPKLPPLEQETVQQASTTRLLPAASPKNFTPEKIDLPDTVMDTVDTPNIPKAPAVATTDWSQTNDISGMQDGFGSAEEYFQRIRMRIESKKKYPSQAKALGREGRVTIRFTIDTNGETRNHKVIHSSGNSHLDKAALRAIRASSPLPALPQRFFSGPKTVELTIAFELF